MYQDPPVGVPCLEAYIGSVGSSGRLLDESTSHMIGWMSNSRSYSESYPRHDSWDCHIYCICRPRKTPSQPPLAVSRQSYGSPMAVVFWDKIYVSCYHDAADVRRVPSIRNGCGVSFALRVATRPSPRRRKSVRRRLLHGAGAAFCSARVQVASHGARLKSGVYQAKSTNPFLSSRWGATRNMTETTGIGSPDLQLVPSI